MANLPTGTVTLLFTDIEGSTRLLHRLGDRYAALLADHHHLVERAIAAHGGAAVGAAAAGQGALAAHAGPDGVAGRVRMGLHPGEPLPAGARYVGLAVDHA